VWSVCSSGRPMNKRCTAMIFFLFLACLASAQDNPLFSGIESAGETDSPPAPGLLQAMGQGIAGLQRELHARLADLSQAVNRRGGGGVLFVLLGIALIYGLVHALGPGHGKVIMVSYVLANPLKVWQGILLGAGVAVIHTLSAVVLVVLLYLVLQSTYQTYGGQPKQVITLVSYGLIVGMGVFLLVRALMRFRRPGDRETQPVSAAGGKAIRNLVVPAVLMGLVPCEGAVLILIFAMSINALWLGIIMAAAMSVGMAITISAIGILALGAKRGSVKLLSRKKRLVDTLLKVLQAAGAVLITGFGLVLFIGRLSCAA
jgi:nickel/cobalt exporter